MNKDEMRADVKPLSKAQKEAIQKDLRQWYERKSPKVFVEGEGWVTSKKTIKVKDLENDFEFILNHIIYK